MNPKIFLFMILIIVLLSNLFMPIIEGNTNCYAIPNKNTVAGAKKAADSCTNTTIYSNGIKLKEVTAKINELKSMSAAISKNISQNTKDIEKNKKDSKALANVADGEDNDQSDACKKYPEACQK